MHAYIIYIEFATKKLLIKSNNMTSIFFCDCDFVFLCQGERRHRTDNDCLPIENKENLNVKLKAFFFLLYRVTFVIITKERNLCRLTMLAHLLTLRVSSAPQVQNVNTSTIFTHSHCILVLSPLGRLRVVTIVNWF